MKAPFRITEVPYYRHKRRVFAMYLKCFKGNRYRGFQDNYVGTRIPVKPPLS